MICQFNWDDMRRTLTLRLPTAVTVTDDSTGESLGRRQRELSFEMERVRRGFASPERASHDGDGLSPRRCHPTSRRVCRRLPWRLA
jgi:hypothetical protein